MGHHDRVPLSRATVVGLLVALAGPPTLVSVSRRIFGDTPSIGVQTFLQLIFCGLALVVVFIVVRGERMSLRSIGVRRPDSSTVVTALMITAAGFLLGLLTAPLENAVGAEGVAGGVAKLAMWPAWFRLFVGATSGIVEETLYRGYAVERLAVLSGRVWLGALIAIVAFGLAHIPFWGVGFSLVADLPYGMLLVLLYLWRRDLFANILAHSGGLIVSLFTTVPWAV
jgi:membrane protease YdiL (CAAX protease family)